MKFEKINENKLKIFLSSGELPSMNSLDELMSDTDVARKSFLAILDKAYSEVGFDTNNYKVKIDAKSLVDGTFILTVTKVVNLVERKKKKKVKPHKIYKNKSELKTITYSFYSLDDFSNLCMEFKRMRISSFNNLCSDSICYKLNGQYFLVVEDVNSNAKRSGQFFTTIIEFCTFVSEDKLFAYSLREHGEVIIKKNAFIVGQKI